MQVLPLGAARYLVAVGISDASIQLLGYDSSAASFSLLCKLHEQRGPVLSLELCRVDAGAVMISGATDGTVAVWRLSGDDLSTAQLDTLVQGCHQSGVNCLSMSCCGSEIVFASGGDDEAVSLHLRTAVHLFRRWHSLQSMKSGITR